MAITEEKPCCALLTGISLTAMAQGFRTQTHTDTHTHTHQHIHIRCTKLLLSPGVGAWISCQMCVMFGAGGNGGFAQVTAPLRVTLKPGRAVHYWLSGVCVCVCRRILRYIILPRFSRKDGDTFYECLGLSGWRVEVLKRHSGILVNKMFFFSECGGGRDRWTERELYGLEGEEELLQWKSSSDSKFISEPLLVSLWPPQGGQERFAQSSTLRVDVALN